jgi:hypothetical protein
MRKRKKLNLKQISTTEDKKNDVIRVTGFKVSPVAPKKGKQVSVIMTMKNVTSRTIKKVPWQIVRNNNILDQGIRYNLMAGDSFRVSVTWTAVAGQHFFYGDADPKNILREPRIKQFNNLPQGIDVKVK